MASPHPRAQEPTPLPPLTFARWFIASLRRWRIGAIAGIAIGGLLVVAALVLPPSYRGEASFVSNTSESVKLPGGLAGLAGMGGLASDMGMNLGGEPSESPAFYVQLVLSRELLTRLLESRFADPRTEVTTDSAELVDILKLGRGQSRARRMELGIELLRRAITPGADPRTNFVELTIDMPWPGLTAAVANRAVELVARFNLEQRTSRARARRQFVEQRLAEAEGELRAAEDRYRDFLLQNRQWRSSPTLTAAENRLDRRVVLASDLVTTLQRQYETARIDEVNNAPVVTLVDAAVPPVRPRWPRPLPLAALALGTALVVGALVAGTAALLADWAARNPADASELRWLVRRRARKRAAQQAGDERPGEGEAPPPSLRAADSHIA
ncbi:MAG: hypothetical protein ACYC2G_07445 [Gemmatimonadaceae bacterium]